MGLLFIRFFSLCLAITPSLAVSPADYLGLTLSHDPLKLVLPVIKVIGRRSRCAFDCAVDPSKTETGVFPPLLLMSKRRRVPAIVEILSLKHETGTIGVEGRRTQLRD